MKKILLTFGFLLAVSASFAQSQVWVNGYTTSTGRYVAGYYRTVANTTATDNYSYYRNTNPNTGTQGTQQLYYNTTPTESRTLYVGSQGGTYYINSNGNKTYVKTR